MKKIDSFINQYSLSKTLRFKLIPVGETLENFKAKCLLEQDQQRASLYEKVKGYIDEYHKYFIDSVFEASKGLDVCAYANLYYKSNKSAEEKKSLNNEAAKLRKSIADILTKHPDFKKLFDKAIIVELLPAFLKDEAKLKEVAAFSLFSTYFYGFHQNRKNMYTDEEKSTGIAYRCINDNLPKYLDNAKSFVDIWDSLSDEEKSAVVIDFDGLLGCSVENMFAVERFDSVISQKGITVYNNLVGGYTLEDGTKIKGLNEYINLYNQKHEKHERLPKLKMLYKQILSDRETVSFIPEKFENDNAVLNAINEYWTSVKTIITKSISELFYTTSNGNGIYVKNGPAITDLSKRLLDSWHILKDRWTAEYDENYAGKKKANYEEEREKAWKSISSFSISQLQKYVGEEKSVLELYKTTVSEKVTAILEAYGEVKALLASDYSQRPKRLASNDSDIALIKNFLDSVKSLEHFLTPLLLDGTEENKDDVFYVDFCDYMDTISAIDRLYDKVRNHVTQKPYSTDKIKLNFENPNFMEGWALGNEVSNSVQLFRKNGTYYLAVMEKSQKKQLPKEYTPSESETDSIEKMVYHQMASPSKDIPNLLVIDGKVVKKNGRKEKSGEHIGENLILEEYRNKYLPPIINDIRKKRSFSVLSEHFSKEDLAKYIAYYMELIPKYYTELQFNFKEAHEYASYNDFISDVDNQAYQIRFEKVSNSEIINLVKNGVLYLFKIHSKDFSEYSKGTPNLHTLYFKALFDRKNLKDVVYKLNGEAEMFYRFPSIKDEERTIHPKGQPINNKNPHTDKATSTFDYDIIKDKRFTVPQFSLHLPITLNFKAIGNERINTQVRKALKDSEHNYVIGIDRGERHLIYVTVIDETGRIVEQFTGNEIINEYNGKTHKVDYHALLTTKEEERLKARQNWNTVENIKELKEGYVSQIVHKICELVVKYDAIIAMEDLNSGFKNSRVKVEKQVYQKFEKMLIDKLNYLVDKKIAPEENGGLLRAYQLTEKFDSFSKMGLQNGFIFYIPAWLTSKIDPVTGFVDLLKPKYSSVSESISFISKFKTIGYNSNEKYFEFTFDYNDFPKGSTDATGLWTVCTNGERIYTHRDESANGNYTDERIILTEKWIELFESAGINWNCDDVKSAILEQTEKKFFERFMHLLRLTLQIRNSVSNTEEDYLISPVKDSNGSFYDSRKAVEGLPVNADANGAYNIARKALWAISVFKNTSDEELPKVKFSITNKDWLTFAQKK